MTFVEDDAIMSSIRYFEIHVTEESKPYQTHFCVTNKCFDTIQINN